MTDYESLAVDLNAAGIKADTGKAHKLATAAWEGRTLGDTEARVVAAWEARTAKAIWISDVARQKGNGA